MVTISILIFIVALALPSLNKSLSPIINLRLSAIILIYAGALSLNALYIQSIGSGIGIYSGLFQVTVVSQSLDTFLLILASLILIPYPTNLLIIKTSSSIQSLALRLQSSKLINKLNSNIKNLKIIDINKSINVIDLVNNNIVIFTESAFEKFLKNKI